MNGHHLILGELTDYITGEILDDTLDERLLQSLARRLVEENGFAREEIEPRRELLVQAGEKRAVIKVDFLVSLSGRIGMLIKYGPGSLVTRHRPALAASRLVAPYQIPIAAATNGEDADILNGATGKVMSRGLEAIPSREDLLALVRGADFEEITPKRAEMESRILFVYEVDGACPCDDNVCLLP